MLEGSLQHSPYGSLPPVDLPQGHRKAIVHRTTTGVKLWDEASSSAMHAAAPRPECWSPAWPACMRREAAPGLLTPLAVSFAADSVTEVPQRGRTASREARRERTQRRQQYAERLSLSHGGKREPVAPLAPPIMREKLEEEDGDTDESLASHDSPCITHNSFPSTTTAPAATQGFPDADNASAAQWPVLALPRRRAQNPDTNDELCGRCPHTHSLKQTNDRGAFDTSAKGYGHDNKKVKQACPHAHDPSATKLKLSSAYNLNLVPLPLQSLPKSPKRVAALEQTTASPARERGNVPEAIRSAALVYADKKLASKIGKMHRRLANLVRLLDASAGHS